MQWAKKQTGFTIVELLIVVVVIAILAAITIVAYNGIRDRANVSAAQSTVQQAAKKIESQKVTDGSYPISLNAVGIDDSGGKIGYSRMDGGQRACVWAQAGSATYSVQSNSTPVEGQCGQVLASYYNTRPAGATPVFTRSEDDFDNNWGTASPDSRIPADNFTVTYKAKIIPPVTGIYTFTVTTDDYSQVFMDGVEVLPYTQTRTSTFTVNLTADQPIDVVYTGAEGGGNAYTIFQWEYSGQARVSVPASVFRRP